MTLRGYNFSELLPMNYMSYHICIIKIMLPPKSSKDFNFLLNIYLIKIYGKEARTLIF